MTTHVGTHVDTPAHFIKDAKNLDAYTIEKWILPAYVVSIKNTEKVQPIELTDLNIGAGDAILLKTSNSTIGTSKGKFNKSYVHLSMEAAAFCVEKKISLVGIDYNSVDKYGDNSNPVHHKLLEHDILILECISLKEVIPGKYTLFCPPLKIQGAEGAPTRAFLVR